MDARTFALLQLPILLAMDQILLTLRQALVLSEQGLALSQVFLGPLPPPRSPAEQARLDRFIGRVLEPLP